ncbi:hypothetical protein ABUK63_07580 [Lactococcus lactis]|uniref:hypothetical protein n=1 Tax=Lactococcus lactis TaxID=1358 RepID=UPI003D283E6D
MKNKTNENFVQIPNKMFMNTNNDEKLVYVKLLQSQMIGYLDKANRTTMTTVSLLATLLGWSKGQYSNKKVVKALNGLKDKKYINFESIQDVFTVQINKWNDKEGHLVPVDWKQSGVKFSGHTQIRFSIIDNLLEGKDFTLYAYTEYRKMKTHQYRICYEEWALVLGMTKDGAFKNVNSSEVIIKVSNGFDSDTKRRETNSYLTFDSVEDVKEVSLKPTYKDKSSKSVVKEEEPDEEDFDSVEDEEISLKAEAKKTVVKEGKYSNKEISSIISQIKGNTREDNILKKMKDPRVTTVEHVKQIQEFDYPMSLEMYEVIGTTKDKVTKDFGIKKLESSTFKKKHKHKLDEEINQKREMEKRNKMIFDLKDKVITMYIQGKKSEVIGVEYLYNLYSDGMLYKENDSYYTSTDKMSTMLEQYGHIEVTEKY